MTESQEKLYHDLRNWADKKGNWVFVKNLDLYYNYLSRQELPVEVIEQKSVRPLEDKLRADWSDVKT